MAIILADVMNDFQAPVSYQCRPGMYFSGWEAEFDKAKNDRKFKIKCTFLQAGKCEVISLSKRQVYFLLLFLFIFANEYGC